MRYLFHNVYGDADELISSKPNDVTCVPFGWSEEIEQERNRLINELNVVVGSLPSLVYSTGQEYKEFRIDDMEKPWTWEKIELAIVTESSNNIIS